MQYPSELVRRLQECFLSVRFTPQRCFIVQIVIVTVCILMYPLPADAQRYHVRTYSEGDGLSSQTVKCVTQDHSGKMWFATRSGISCYDGVKWETFGIKDGLPSLAQSSILVEVYSGGEYQIFEVEVERSQ